MATPAHTTRAWRFGIYEVDAQKEELRRAGTPIKLREQSFRILIFLLEHAGELVTREELHHLLWPADTFVDFEHSLNVAVMKLREALGDTADKPLYIETIPKRGYRFIAPVNNRFEGQPAAPNGPGAAAVQTSPREADPEIYLVQSNGSASPVQLKETVLAEGGAPDSRIRAGIWKWTSLAACLAALSAFLWYLRRPLPPPRFAEYVQLTNDGRRKSVRGTDGKNVFLNLTSPGGVAVVPVSGGQLTPIAIDLPTKKDFPNEDPIMGPVSPDGSRLLVGFHFEYLKGFDLWVVGAQGHPSRYLAKVFVVTWSPDGKAVLYSTLHGDLYTIPVEGGESHLLLASPAPAGQLLYTSYLVWSPDGGRIRFVRNERYWEVSANGSGLHEVFPGWKPSTPMCCGEWTPDGDFFLFVAGEGLSNDLITLGAPIWVQDERRNQLHPPNPAPVQMTTGPTRWSDIAVSNDGRKVYSRGITSRGELVIKEPKSNELLPYLGGISAEHVSFSKDGKYLVYVSFPDGVMWWANRDGSGLMQLTQPPVHPQNPWWSPDGSKILFNDLSPDGVVAMYTVSSRGGKPTRVLPNDSDNEGDPTWSPDGKKILFNRSYTDKPLKAEPPSTCIVDLTTRNIQTLPPSPKVFWSPRWSPDGRYIVGLTSSPVDNLELFDMETGKWSLLNPQQGRLNYPTWSHDGRFIYFVVGSFYQLESPGEAGVYRIPVTGGKPEKVVDLRGFRHMGWYGVWMGLDPDDRPMLLRDEGTDEIYALTLERK